MTERERGELSITPEGRAALEEMQRTMRGVVALPKDAQGIPLEWNLAVGTYPMEGNPQLRRDRTDAIETMELFAPKVVDALASDMMKRADTVTKDCRVELDLLRTLPPVRDEQQPATIETLLRWMRQCDSASLLAWIETQPDRATEGWRFDKLYEATEWIELSRSGRDRASKGVGLFFDATRKKGERLHAWRAHIGLLAIGLTPHLSTEFLDALMRQTPLYSEHVDLDPAEHRDTDEGMTQDGCTKEQVRKDDQTSASTRKPSAADRSVESRTALSPGDVARTLISRAYGRPHRASRTKPGIFSMQHWNTYRLESVIACLPSPLRPAPVDHTALGYGIAIAVSEIQQFINCSQENPTARQAGEENMQGNQNERLTNVQRVSYLFEGHGAGHYCTLSQWREIIALLGHPAVRGEWWTVTLVLAALENDDVSADAALQSQLFRHLVDITGHHAIKEEVLTGVVRSVASTSRVHRFADSQEISRGAHESMHPEHSPRRQEAFREEGTRNEGVRPIGPSGGAGSAGRIPNGAAPSLSPAARRALRCVLLTAVEALQEDGLTHQVELDLQSLAVMAATLDPRDELRPLIGSLVLRSSRADWGDPSWDNFLNQSPRVAPGGAAVSPLAQLITEIIRTHATAQGRPIGIGTVADLWIRQIPKTMRPVCAAGDALWKTFCQEKDSPFWVILAVCDVDVMKNAPEAFWRLALSRPERNEREFWIRRLAQRRRSSGTGSSTPLPRGASEPRRSRS